MLTLVLALPINFVISDNTQLLLLIAAEPMPKPFGMKIEGRMIKRKFDEFRKMLKGHFKTLLP